MQGYCAQKMKNRNFVHDYFAQKFKNQVFVHDKERKNRKKVLSELWVFSVSMCLDSKKLKVQYAEVVHAGAIRAYEILKNKGFR